MVQIRLFDTVGISVDGAPVSLPYKQAEFVLAYLILSQPDPVDKDLLAELLWPGKSPGIGRRNLRHALHTLRTRLGLEESILSTKSQIRFIPNGQVECDYCILRELFREQDIDARTERENVVRIIDLYKNGLMEYSSAEPSPEFGFWLLLKRKDCADAAVAKLLKAVPQLCDRKDYPLLTRLAERLFVWDPINTAPYEYLLRSMLSRNDQAGALMIHRQVAGVAAKLGDAEATNALADASRRVFPKSLRPASARKMLPALLVPFVGRERELAELRSILGNPENRLITICAPGGYGKTSIATALGRALEAAAYPDGVYFADWQACGDERACAEEILRSLGLTGNDHDIRRTLFDYLRDKRLLVILDEIEDRRFGYPLLEELLKEAPEVQLLATSRRRTELTAEWVYPLPPFSTVSDSAAFFLKTAERKTGKRRWSDREKAFVEEICRRLNGIPLALELAAARISDQDIGSLCRRIRTDPGRVLTEDAVLNAVTSYQLELLDEKERIPYCFLALFSGDFDKKTACAAFSIPDDSFAEYCKLSLLWASGKGFFRIHSHLRAHALNALRERGLYGEGQERLFGFLADWAERNFSRMFLMNGDPQDAAIRYPRELEAAWCYSLRNGRWDWALKIVAPFGSYIHYAGQSRKGRDLFTEKFHELAQSTSVESSQEACHVVLQIGLVAAVLELQARDPDSARSILAGMRALDERSGFGLLIEKEEERDTHRQWLFIAFSWIGGVSALLAGEETEAEAVFSFCREKAMLYSAHLCRIYIDMYRAMAASRSRPAEALEILLEALSACRSCPIPGLLSELYLHLANVEHAMGDLEHARKHAEAALKSSAGRQGSHTEMQALFLLGILQIAPGVAPEIPETYLAKALDTARKNRTGLAAAEWSLQYVARHVEAYKKPPAASVCGEIESHLKRHGLESALAELNRFL